MLKGQKRISSSDAFHKAIVVLKDCGDMSFYMIAVLLKGDKAHKRNMIYYYKRDRGKYDCRKKVVLGNTSSNK